MDATIPSHFPEQLWDLVSMAPMLERLALYLRVPKLTWTDTELPLPKLESYAGRLPMLQRLHLILLRVRADNLVEFL